MSPTHVLRPQIRADVDSLGLPVTSLIDTRVDANTISYNLRKEIGKLHLQPTQLTITSFLGQPIALSGTCRLPMYVCGYDCLHDFNVFPKDPLDMQIILGQPWKRKFYCTLKWSKNATHLV